MRIKLTPGSNGESITATAQRGLRLHLPIRGPGVSLSHGTRQQSEALRATAAAVALVAPEEALKRVKRGRDNPSQVIEPTLNAAKLAKIVSAIDSARGAPTGSMPADEIVAAARSVDAAPKLVQAAQAVVSMDQSILTNGLDWVAAVDVDMLDRAARAGTREKLLDAHVPLSKRLMGLAHLEKRVDGLTDRITKLERAPSGPARVHGRASGKKAKLATKVPKPAIP